MEIPLPFSQASDNNKQPIFDGLRRHLLNPGSVLEVGGGTGQHAVFFAERLPFINWQSTDLPENVILLNQRISHANLPNLPLACPLDVNQETWLRHPVDAVFTANSLHIMSISSVNNFFRGVGRVLKPGGLLFVYGPVKYQGLFTTESNAKFDLWLKSRDPVSGVRDFETFDRLALAIDLELVEDNDMPANNQLLVWKKQALTPRSLVRS